MAALGLQSLEQAARGAALGFWPDESTLKRRLRDIWAMFAPEATDKAA